MHLFSTLRKHRQVLLNAAHFLRLYNQSSQAIATELKHYSNFTCSEVDETIEESNLDCVTEILKKHGLRLLWDAFYNSEFLRSLLILEFLKSSNLLCDESLDYFKKQLIEKVSKAILGGFECGNDVLSAVFLSPEYANSLLIEIKFSLSSKNIQAALPSLAQFYSKLGNINRDRSPFHLFTEKDSNYCEFPHLKQIKTDAVNLCADLNGFKAQLKEFVTEQLLKSLETSTEDTNVEILRQLEIDEKVIKTITDKISEFKIKGTSEKLKFELFELFDKLMKSIQTTVRTNEIKFDEALQNRTDSVCALLIESSNPDIDPLLPTLLQTLQNKANIIFTIHRNELAALNSKRENNPIGSRLYLAIVLIRKLFKDKQVLFEPIISELINIFLDAWISDINSAFNNLRAKHEELLSLSWLSIHFINLNVNANEIETILSSLGFSTQEIKSKYFDQAALLSGLVEPEKAPSPPLKASQVTETNAHEQLLPHFISL